MDISVIVPCYNRANLLPRALDSILEQSYLPREIILVDDGSSDHTARLVGDRYPRIRYLYQRHAGVSAARNRGIHAARHEWLAFLDSDDEWERDKLAKQADRLAASPATQWVHSNEAWIRNGRPQRQGRQHRKAGGDIFELCLIRCCVSPSTVVLHRNLFEEHGCFDESLRACEDYDLWLRIAAHKPILFVEDVLAKKHDGHPKQLSHTTPALDKYRIRAIERLLSCNQLDVDRQQLARNELKKKLKIYLAGARKRGHLDVVEHYASLWRNLTGTDLP